MIFNKNFFNGFLLGLLLFVPVSSFGVDTSPLTNPITVDNIKTSNYYIDISASDWQKTNTGSTTNRQRFIINDFGTMNQISPSNTGNSTGLPNEFSGNDNYIVEERSPVSSVPEPMTILLLGLGSLGLAAYRRRR